MLIKWAGPLEKIIKHPTKPEICGGSSRPDLGGLILVEGPGGVFCVNESDNVAKKVKRHEEVAKSPCKWSLLFSKCVNYN